MKRVFIITALAISSYAAAQAQLDSTAVEDSIFRSLPEVMVSGRRPIVKAEPGKLVFDMQALTKDRPADNAYDALKEIPGVNEQDDKLTLNGSGVTLILDGKVSTLVVLNGEDAYATLIDNVNVIIDKQKSTLASRSTRSAKKSKTKAAAAE